MRCDLTFFIIAVCFVGPIQTHNIQILKRQSVKILHLAVCAGLCAPVWGMARSAVEEQKEIETDECEQGDEKWIKKETFTVARLCQNMRYK